MSLTDGGTGLINVPFDTSVGNWTINSLTAFSQPYVGDATDDYVYIYGGSLSGTDSTPLTITATETGFSAFPTADTFDMSLNTLSSATETGKINSTVIGTLGPSSGVSSQTVSGPPSMFSMTDQLVVQPAFTAANGEVYLFSSVGGSPTPEPGTVTLLISALLGLAGVTYLRRRRA